MSTISVFIENPAGAALKHCFDEKRQVIKSVTPVSRPYPYHYGFVLNTDAADGDNLDCFVLTERRLATGEVVECAVLGLMEQLEDGIVDHNIIACPTGEEIQVTVAVKSALSDFVSHVFDHIEGKVVQPGRFLDAKAALSHLTACQR